MLRAIEALTSLGNLTITSPIRRQNLYQNIIELSDNNLLAILSKESNWVQPLIEDVLSAINNTESFKFYNQLLHRLFIQLQIQPLEKEIDNLTDYIQKNLVKLVEIVKTGSDPILTALFFDFWAYVVIILQTKCRDRNIVNDLCSVYLSGFKSNQEIILKAAYRSWRSLILAFANVINEWTSFKHISQNCYSRIQLLTKPLYCVKVNSYEKATDEIFETWWYLAKSLDARLPLVFEEVIVSFMLFCIGGELNILPPENINEIFGQQFLLNNIASRRRLTIFSSKPYKTKRLFPFFPSLVNKAFQLIEALLKEDGDFAYAFTCNNKVNTITDYTLFVSQFIRVLSYNVVQNEKECQTNLFKRIPMIWCYFAKRLNSNYSDDDWKLQLKIFQSQLIQFCLHDNHKAEFSKICIAELLTVSENLKKEIFDLITSIMSKLCTQIDKSNELDMINVESNENKNNCNLSQLFIDKENEKILQDSLQINLTYVSTSDKILSETNSNSLIQNSPDAKKKINLQDKTLIETTNILPLNITNDVRKQEQEKNLRNKNNKDCVTLDSLPNSNQSLETNKNEKNCITDTNINQINKDSTENLTQLKNKNFTTLKCVTSENLSTLGAKRGRKPKKIDQSNEFIPSIVKKANTQSFVETTKRPTRAAKLKAETIFTAHTKEKKTKKNNKKLKDNNFSINSTNDTIKNEIVEDVVIDLMFNKTISDPCKTVEKIITYKNNLKETSYKNVAKYCQTTTKDNLEFIENININNNCETSVNNSFLSNEPTSFIGLENEEVEENEENSNFIVKSIDEKKKSLELIKSDCTEKTNLRDNSIKELEINTESNLLKRIVPNPHNGEEDNKNDDTQELEKKSTFFTVGTPVQKFLLNKPSQTPPSILKKTFSPASGSAKRNCRVHFEPGVLDDNNFKQDKCTTPHFKRGRKIMHSFSPLNKGGVNKLSNKRKATFLTSYSNNNTNSGLPYKIGESSPSCLGKRSALINQNNSLSYEKMRKMSDAKKSDSVDVSVSAKSLFSTLSTSDLTNTETKKIEDVVSFMPECVNCQELISFKLCQVLAPSASTSLYQQLKAKKIITVGQLASLSESEVMQLPIRQSAKIDKVRELLRKWYNKNFVSTAFKLNTDKSVETVLEKESQSTSFIPIKINQSRSNENLGLNEIKEKFLFKKNNNSNLIANNSENSIFKNQLWSNNLESINNNELYPITEETTLNSSYNNSTNYGEEFFEDSVVVTNNSQYHLPNTFNQENDNSIEIENCFFEAKNPSINSCELDVYKNNELVEETSEHKNLPDNQINEELINKMIEESNNVQDWKNITPETMAKLANLLKILSNGIQIHLTKNITN